MLRRAYELQCVRSIRTGHRQLWHRFVILWYRVGLFVVDAALRWLCSLACRITSHGMPESRGSPVDLQMVHLCGRCRAPGAMLVPARGRAFYPVCSFLGGFVPDGDEFAEACAERDIGLDDVSHGRITLDSTGRTNLERGGASSCTAARCMLGGSARDAQDALALSPTRAQHSEAYATL